MIDGVAVNGKFITRKEYDARVEVASKELQEVLGCKVLENLRSQSPTVEILPLPANGEYPSAMEIDYYADHLT